MQARMLIFGKQVDVGLFYDGIENQPTHVYSSLYLSIFFSFHTLKNQTFVTVSSTTLQARVAIFGTQVNDDLLYSGIEN